MCVFVPVHSGQKRALDTLELELWVEVNSLIQVLGAELLSSAAEDLSSVPRPVWWLIVTCNLISGEL